MSPYLGDEWTIGQTDLSAFTFIVLLHRVFFPVRTKVPLTLSFPPCSIVLRMRLVCSRPLAYNFIKTPVLYIYAQPIWCNSNATHKGHVENYTCGKNYNLHPPSLPKNRLFITCCCILISTCPFFFLLSSRVIIKCLPK